MREQLAKRLYWVFRDNDTEMLMSPFFSLASPLSGTLEIHLNIQCPHFTLWLYNLTHIWAQLKLTHKSEVFRELMIKKTKQASESCCHRQRLPTAGFQPPPKTLLMAISTCPPFHIHSWEGRADRLTDCPPKSIFLFCHSLSPRWKPTLLSPKQNRFSISTP